MSYPHSLVVITTDANKQDLLDLGAAYGVDGGMSVPLSADGTDPATHWGSHSWAGPEFVAIMTKQVTVEVEGYDEAAINAILDLCIVSVDKVVDAGLETERKLKNREHFDAVLADESLAIIVPEEV